MAKSAVYKQPFHLARRGLAGIWYRLFPNLTTIALTGSYGKTSTARAIVSVLSQKFLTVSTDINLDTVYNLPITLLKIRPKHRQLVLELGVDHLGEMASYLKLVKPEIGVLTGITPVHTSPGLLGSLKEVISEKGKLLEALPKDGLAVLNHDDKFVQQMASKTKSKIIWYGLEKGAKTDYWAGRIKVTEKGTTFELHADPSLVNNGPILMKTGLVGRHFIHACLVASAVGRSFGLSWREIQTGISRLMPLKGRVSVESGPRGSVLINDALRANPASTLAGLKVLVDLPTKGKRIAVLGEMGELGKAAKKSHQAVGEAAAKLKIDYLVSIGPLQKHTALAAIRSGLKPGNVFQAEDVFQAAEVLGSLLGKEDLFYLKGSLLRHLERVLLVLSGQAVGCRVTSCRFYHQCPACPYLKSGLK